MGYKYITDGGLSTAWIAGRIAIYQVSDPATGMSTITPSLQVRARTSFDVIAGLSDFAVTVNGKKTAISPYVSVHGYDTTWITIWTGSPTTITHASDGSASVSAKWSGGIPGTIWTATSISGSVSLDPVQRGYALTSASPADVGGSMAITIDTHGDTAIYPVVTLSVGGSAVASYSDLPAGASSYDALIDPAVWLPVMPSASVAVQARLISYLEAAHITPVGVVSEIATTVRIPDNYAPVVGAGAIVVTPAQPVGVSACPVPIQGVSGVGVSVDATRIQITTGATLASSAVVFDGATYNPPVSLPAISAAGTAEITLRVEDSRGMAGQGFASFPVLPYTRPSMASVTIGRYDAQGDPAPDTGTRIMASATAIYSPCHYGGTDYNACVIQGRVKPTVSGVWGAWVSMSSGSLTQLDGAVTPTISYDVQLRIADSVGYASVWDVVVPTASVIFNARDAGDGVAFGMYADRPGLQIADGWQVLVHDSIHVDGDLEVDGDISVGGTGLPAPSDDTPHMDYAGGAAGSSVAYARADHEHPVDTSRAATIHTHDASEIITGVLGLGLGGTGVSAATVKGLLDSYGIEIATGSVTGVGTSAKHVSMSMTHTPTLVLATCNSGNAAPYKITGASNTGFDIQSTQSGVGYKWIAIYWGV